MKRFFPGLVFGTGGVLDRRQFRSGEEVHRWHRPWRLWKNSGAGRWPG